MKKVQRFRVRSKLAPRYVGPYQILEWKGPVAYKVQLPEELSSIFLVFLVSQLRKCLKVPKQRIEPRGIKIKAYLEYKEQLVGIVDTKERVTRNRVVKTYKVVWSHHDDRDATWETEDYLKAIYPKYHKKWLVTQNLGMRFFRGGKGCNTLGVKHALSLINPLISILIKHSINSCMILCA